MFCLVRVMLRLWGLPKTTKESQLILKSKEPFFSLKLGFLVHLTQKLRAESAKFS